MGFMPLMLVSYPDDGPLERDELDDRHIWPGAVEAEHVPGDLEQEALETEQVLGSFTTRTTCDICGLLWDCTVIPRPRITLYVCDVCAHEHAADLESLRVVDMAEVAA